ncbi:UNVERIFIED_CONTAM: LINE-1 retrotransposable element O protein [Sesamum latifolium]|uniref:LINE-1 retrotransposable element O protein n=1 Tax=Sesamum latifolium TaxID=2727402 RepID=A0AAW2TLQ7_9LAMI
MIREVLDKIISPSQNAFVPERSIADNILLAQELFTGYNQKHLPRRCALKVDLRKAYDTVEWDFLIAVMHLFGFPQLFIHWIKECATTPTFSVCLNGAAHGFFAGARGLRQGDPMSPYLFVLVIEVLRMLLQQLIDQDRDFIFHWNASQMICSFVQQSISLFKRGLEMFAALSGLHVSPTKSHLILSKSAQYNRDGLLGVLGFQEGHLPVRYLGLHLIASRLSLSDCKPLLSKIDSRIRDWGGQQLSFAARIQLIKSVIISLNIYWAMAFILPKGVIREIENGCGLSYRRGFGRWIPEGHMESSMSAD